MSGGTLVAAPHGVVGALVAGALTKLDATVHREHAVPTGELADQSAAWLELLEDAAPERLLVNLALVNAAGLAADAADGVRSLCAACARARSVSAVVVVSSGELYGAAGDHPTFVTEAQKPAEPETRTTRGLLAIEHAAADLAAVRPDMALTILRPTEVLGDPPHGVLAVHLQESGRRMGTEIGYDPQVQVMTDHDFAVVVLRALEEPVPGVYNIGPVDAVAVSDAAACAGKARMALNRPLTHLGSAVSFGRPWTRELARFLTFGRALDTARAGRAGLGTPATTAGSISGAFR